MPTGEARLSTFLYKVSPPRADSLFQPRMYWHTPDWQSSSDRPKPGYLADSVLFAGDFDEISIHLFPRVRTVRVRTRDADQARLTAIGLPCEPGRSAIIFCARASRDEIQAFAPTIFSFLAPGFTCVRNGEYISRVPQQAVSCTTVPLAQALRIWNLQACYVIDLDAVITTLTRAGIVFDEQT